MSPAKKSPASLPPHFIVIVPGYMGSKLRDPHTGEIIWLDVPGMLSNPLQVGAAVENMLEKMKYPNPLEPAGIMDQLLIASPWVKQEHYGRLMDCLKQWKYRIDPADAQPGDRAVYTFSYDWRQDNRLSARQLGQAIEGWRQHPPGAQAWLIAHSNGGSVSRWYIQQEGGRQHVGKLFLMASPWDGAPKSVRVLMEGMEVLGLKKFNLWHLGPRMKDLIRSFPSYYQLIPFTNPFLHNENNAVVNLYQDQRWLDNPRDLAYLASALEFNQALAEPTGVETICVYGTRNTTTTAGLIVQDPAGKIESIQWLETAAGDGTVPARSAVHPWVQEDHRVHSSAAHGDIYVENGVLDYLRFELTGRRAGPARAANSQAGYTVVFEPDHDFYTPGAPLQVWAQVTGDAGPVEDASIKVQCVFRQPLPGAQAPAPPPPSAWVRLRPLDQAPGRYSAALTVPAVEGYYRLLARVKLPRQPALELEELIIVEA